MHMYLSWPFSPRPSETPCSAPGVWDLRTGSNGIDPSLEEPIEGGGIRGKR